MGQLTGDGWMISVTGEHGQIKRAA